MRTSRNHVTLAALALLSGCDQPTHEDRSVSSTMLQAATVETICDYGTSYYPHDPDPCVAYWLRKIYESQTPTKGGK